MKILNVALIGYGFAGRVFHAPVLTAVPGLKLAKVVQRSSQSAKLRYPWVEVVNDLADVLDDESIDLVVVATPSDNHAGLAEAVLKAGKHVVVEKPFTTTSAEADRLIELAKQQNRLLSVYHNRRWDGDFLTVRHVIEQGMLGEIIEFQSGWDRYRPSLNLDAWREQGQAGSGILYDLGVHLFDQTLCLFGEPSSVTADIRIQRENGLSDDYFEIALGYERLKVIVKSTKLVREPGPRYRVHGTKGSYVKYGDEPQEALLIAGRQPTEAGWGAEPQELWGKINTDWNGLHLQGQVETLRGSYCSYYQDIYEAITMNRPPAVLPEQARQTIRLVELARQSYEERRTVDYS